MGIPHPIPNLNKLVKKYYPDEIYKATTLKTFSSINHPSTSTQTPKTPRLNHRGSSNNHPPHPLCDVVYISKSDDSDSDCEETTTHIKDEDFQSKLFGYISD